MDERSLLAELRDRFDIPEDDPWINEHLRAIQTAARQYAGHRTPDEHDCFLMNCRTLGAEVRQLQERLAAEYANGHRDGFGCGQETVAPLGIAECEHVAALLPTQASDSPEKP